uniref:Fatty acid-binding protein homolog 2 n=1 Tax=Schistocephalus solidus TaxID=70667 RepID=A0A0X3NYU1_SCHSO
MEAFCGIWKLTDTEGFNEITQRLGLNSAQRTVAMTSKPTMVIAPLGECYSLKMSNGFQLHEFVFTLNNEFDLNTINGDQVKTLITLEGNTLKQVDTGDKIIYVDRVVEGDTLTVVSIYFSL